MRFRRESRRAHGDLESQDGQAVRHKIPLRSSSPAVGAGGHLHDDAVAVGLEGGGLGDGLGDLGRHVCGCAFL